MRELAERAVACKHWRWMPGMALCYGAFRVLSEEENREHTIYGPDGEGDYEVIAADIYRMLPDLTDPATLGCLLALVRDAWEPHRGDDSIPSTMQIGDKWAVGTTAHSTLACIVLPAFDTEVEALVAALEAAP